MVGESSSAPARPRAVRSERCARVVAFLASNANTNISGESVREGQAKAGETSVRGRAHVRVEEGA
jgi:hypothetical protein